MQQEKKNTSETAIDETKNMIIGEQNKIKSGAQNQVTFTKDEQPPIKQPGNNESFMNDEQPPINRPVNKYSISYKVSNIFRKQLIKDDEAEWKSDENTIDRSFQVLMPIVYFIFCLSYFGYYLTIDQQNI